jgi:DNA-binding NarL/FixJ family response regulator
VTLRCLIIDDSLEFLEAARSLLEREGLTVVGVAATGSDGIRGIGDLRPQVVLLDIDLGGDSGFTVARQIEEVAATTVILISTHDADDFAEFIAESPAAGFIPKSELSAHAIYDVLGAQPNDGASASRGK